LVGTVNMILAHDCNLEFSRKSTNDLIEDGLESFRYIFIPTHS
jgi:hypothetical protein